MLPRPQTEGGRSRKQLDANFEATPFIPTRSAPSSWDTPHQPGTDSTSKLQSSPRRHPKIAAPPSDVLDEQLDATKRALLLAKDELAQEKKRAEREERAAVQSRRAEAVEKQRAESARQEAERAWSSAWASAERERSKRELALASRLEHDRQALDDELKARADMHERERRAERSAQEKELERRVAAELIKREDSLARQVPQLHAQIEALEQERRRGDERRRVLEEQAHAMQVAAAAAEERAAARAQESREGRIAHLQSQAVRRIQNAGLTAGWGAWHEQWAEAAAQKRMLAGAATRLVRPQLAACVAHWCADWRKTTLAASTEGLAQQIEELRAEAERRHAEHEASKAALEAAHAQQLERLCVELSGSAEEQAALREAQEREERVQTLGRKAMRRIQNAGLSAGWSAWHEQWAEQAAQKRMLAAAGARLARPQLAATLSHWKDDWMAERDTALKGSAQRLIDVTAEYDELNELLKRLRTEAAAAREMVEAEKAAALARAEEKQQAALERQHAELMGTAEEAQAAREARERKERVQTLGRRAMRRIQNTGLSAGWSAWHEQWAEAEAQKRMLAGAAARLARPQLAACLALWKDDWHVEHVHAANSVAGAAAAKQSREMEEALAAAAAERVAVVAGAHAERAAALQAAQEEREAAVRELRQEHRTTKEKHATELAALRSEMAAALAAAADERSAALERQREELAGSSEEAIEARAKEERIELLRKQAARRIQNAGITAGWTAWHAMWEERAYQKRLLAGAAARLARPQQVWCFGAWRTSLEASREAGVAKEREELEAAIEAAKQETAAALAKVEERHHLALERQRAELLGTQEEALAVKAASERDGRIEMIRKQAARRLQHQGLLRGWETWQQAAEEAARQKRLMQSAAARLARPTQLAVLTALRDNWQSERHRASSRSARGQLQAARREAGAERRAAAETRLKLEKTIRLLEKQIRQMGEKIVVPIPAPEPTTIVLHSIAARGVPDADAAGGADPYARFILLDSSESTKKETCYTSYKYKEFSPTWEDERLQLKLAPGGKRPPRVRIEVWDKDMHSPDDLIASGEVVLHNCTDGGTGTLTLCLAGEEPDDEGVEQGDVEAFTFSYIFQAEAEEAQAPKASKMPTGAERKTSIQKIKEDKAGSGGAKPKK